MVNLHEISQHYEWMMGCKRWKHIYIYIFLEIFEEGEGMNNGTAFWRGEEDNKLSVMMDNGGRERKFQILKCCKTKFADNEVNNKEW